MAGLDLTDIVRKTFLAGVGAVATGAEKSQTVINDLVKKGELTVEQGKALNEELKHRAKDAVDDSSDTLLKARLAAMSPEERAAYVARAAKIAKDLDAEPVEVEVDEPADEAGTGDDAATE